MTTTMTRRGPLLRRLDVAPPCPCPRCGRPLVVIDHRTPRFAPTASSELRYEVHCDACLWCDPDGYRTQAQVVAALNKEAGK